MIKQLHFLTHIVFVLSISCFISCDKKHSDADFTAYFGGEVLNPESNYVLFMKDNKLIDTIFLDKDNRFLHKFDSLKPGLYTFKHQPEYQYVYFDKNDSLMVIINSRDFDNSIVFCGRGDEKNNFLMEMYLSNEKDRSNMYDVFFRNSNAFIKNIDSSFAIRKKIYDKHKKDCNWSENFDSLAKASLNLPHYFKKEVYPYAHKFITGKNIIHELPKEYYNHRKNIDFTNNTFANYSPYIDYVTSLLNNITFTESNGNISELDLDNNIKKLNIADTLIKNQKIKNTVLNGLTLRFLMKEQNLYSNNAFIKRYLELSTDNEMKNDIKKIEKSISKLSVGKKLPVEKFVNAKNEPVSIENLITNQTVIFFCNLKIPSHLKSVHKKVNSLKEKYPNINFISINIDDSYEDWKMKLVDFENKNIEEIHAVDSKTLKEDFVIYKIHRTLILNPDGTIKHGFANLYDVNFEEYLK